MHVCIKVGALYGSNCAVRPFFPCIRSACTCVGVFYTDCMSGIVAVLECAPTLSLRDMKPVVRTVSSCILRIVQYRNTNAVPS
jgi:hypothetical protein